MKEVFLQYTKTSLKDLKKLEKRVSLRILKKIKENSEMKNPLQRAKVIIGISDDVYRYRIGDYRAIFQYNAEGKLIVLNALSIKHRREIHKK